MAEFQRLIVVSNRLPVSVGKRDDGKHRATRSPGGLVAAMEPVLKDRGGVWVGWPGTTEEVPKLKELIDKATSDAGYEIIPVTLTREERDEFYYGYSNEVIWPLFHDLQSMCNFDPSYWPAYSSVNERYADVIAAAYREGDLIWVHDYQLMCVAQALRAKIPQARIAFFLHTPFPPFDIFEKLPQQPRMLRALLAHDLLGFQTRRDERNFLGCLRQVIPEASRKHERASQLPWEGRQVRIGHFPIGIDFDHYAENAASDAVSLKVDEIRKAFRESCIVLGMDRLDYTKGIPNRLDAIDEALRRFPELHGRIVFVQTAVPSRSEIPEYNELKLKIEQMVGGINGRYSREGWAPIHYLYRSLPFEEFMAYYRAAEIALVTPLKDGMNLVAKEFCAAHRDDDAVLILSRFAGAADQFKRGALLVNPYDVEQVADAIHEAFSMGTEERQRRMRLLRRNVKKEDVFWWVESFLAAAAA